MTADVCILVEGTYPYVSGGVSTWVHALISNLPDLTFSVVHLGSTPQPDRKPRYTLPPNVVGLHEVFLHDSDWMNRQQSGRGTPRPRLCPETSQQLREFHQTLADGQPACWHHLRSQLTAGPGRPTGRDLLFAPESWDLLLERYAAQAPTSSFPDYFWTFRFTHMPLFMLAEVELRPARLYHAVSTGYVGFLAATQSLRTKTPLLLTEHGIYTREREIEIAQSKWIFEEATDSRSLHNRLSHFKRWWIEMFRWMATTTYDASAAVITITGVNQRYQIANGADPSRMLVIPNGIDNARFENLRADQRGDGVFRVGLVGRVVPIKDVKTFITAMKLASEVIPNLQAYVIGPTDEDESYFEECRALAEMLGVAELVHFTGQANVSDYYSTLDVLVLTSLSEAQPLVILEASCAGVPVVSTDVGACSELLNGGTPEDQALGRSGLLTPISSPAETASAVILLASDPDLRERLARAGQERVRRFYRQEAMYAAYRDLYRQHMCAHGTLAAR